MIPDGTTLESQVASVEGDPRMSTGVLDASRRELGRRRDFVWSCCGQRDCHQDADYEMVVEMVLDSTNKLDAVRSGEVNNYC